MKIARILAALVLLLVFVLAPAVLAQTGGTEMPGGATATPVSSLAPAVRLDTPVTVQLSGTTPTRLSYKSAGNEIVSITARSLEAEDVLDPSLTILDPIGAQIASNDDHRTSRTDLAPHDSLVAGLSLSAPGRYTIEITSVDASVQGNVEVLVKSGIPPTAETPPTDTLSDRVPDNSPYTYNFQANSGEIVTISVRATDNQLDPTVSLRDNANRELASNDDQTTDPSLGPYDSEIANFTIPETGTYTVQITGFAGIGGTFDLTIARGGTQAVVTNPTPAPATPTEAGIVTPQVIQGSVASNDVYTYTLDGNAGDVYTITVQAVTTDFDPRVSIYLDDNYVMDNDDYGSTDSNMQSTDARIYDLILTESGSYEIDVRGYQDSAGDFTLTLDRVATGAPTRALTDSDQDVQLGSVASGDTYTYSFDAQAGDWVTITARNLTQGFDPYITLLSDDGTVLIDNDNDGSTYGDFAYYDARIPNYHITTAGTYTVEVSGVQGSSGSFGLTIATLR